ncbi:MAG: hypothetical protein ACO3E1_01360 [Flavobacteriales bacterium]
MKQFILKISILSFIGLGAVYLSVLQNAKLFRDINHSKFKAKHKSLIIGTSRANFAIDPSAFDAKYDLLNFAFTAATSPYGELYYNAIQDKITKEKDAIFILDIDPFALSQEKQKPTFNEDKNSLGRQKIINANPNFEYIFKNETPLYDRLFPAMESNKVKFENGFTQLNNNYTAEQEIAMRKAKIEDYKKLALSNCLSNERMLYFEKTIELLKQYGKVYLISVPVSPEIYSMQKNYWASKDEFISMLVKKHNIKYFNLQNSFPSPKTIDGVHISKEDARNISLALRDSIARYQK